ncbi:hypothetical protein FNY66_09815 [Mediterraneibacter catenae]|uniref:Uncharacterized protein n=1 Tax=Mediterraneibacter catenae TaxID=2594882 RepID=A0A5M9HW50_9FIRM|nr:DUF6661 family protein [Mediterraneibacter catenae]KAA8501194.1 hypothetical protein FNY66_09815 [Mediterraneibacter catenae]
MEEANTVIEESSLRFTFDEDTEAVKFDDTDFYRRRFSSFPGAKGIDILAESKEIIQLIEIKNCTGHESENIWRTSVNNSKIESVPRGLDMSRRNSLDIEVVQKVASTIACLYGAWTKSERMESSTELSCFWKSMVDEKIPRDRKKLLVILFLEGDFDSNGPRSRNKNMVMYRIQESIRSKLVWLNCQVAVVDSHTYKDKYFKVSRLAN